MQKQALTPTCKCGQVISFSKGVSKRKCSTRNCGMSWERGPEGYWAIGNITILFTPIITREKACSVRSRKDRYANYPKSSRKRKGKAGTR